MIELLDHNKKAYNNLLLMHKNVKKAAIIHPTGTGKMYIALKWLMDNRDKRCLYVAPSTAVMYELKSALEENNLTLKDLPNLNLALYGNLLNWESEDFLGYDRIVLDEFHRAGAPKWEEKINALLEKNPEALVLGLSATPVRYVDKIDMAEKLFAGNIASHMSLAEAISLGILPFPKYITCMYSLAVEVENYRKRAANIKDKNKQKKIFDLLEKANKYLENAIGIEEIIKSQITKKDGKYLIFCRDIEHLNKMKPIIQKWFQDINELIVYEVHSNLDDKENRETIDRFRNDDSNFLKVLLSVNMLNEGVHIKNVDGVIFLRSTESHIIYLQQLGRALATNKNNTPLIIDIVNNFSSYESFYDFREEIIRKLGYEGYGLELPDDLIEKFKIEGYNQNLMDILTDIDKIYTSTYTSEDYLNAIRAYLKETGLPYSSIKQSTVYYSDFGKYKIGEWLKYIKAKISTKITPEYLKIKAELMELGETFLQKKYFYDDEVWLDKLDDYMKKYNLAYTDVSVKACLEDDTGIYNIGTWLGRVRRKHIEFESKLRKDDISNKLYEELKRRGETFVYRNNVYPSSVWIEKIKDYLETTGKPYSSITVKTKYVDEDGVVFNIGSWIFGRRKIEIDYQNNVTSKPLDDYTKRELSSLGETFKQIVKRMPNEKWIEKIKDYLKNNPYSSIDKDTVYRDDTGVYRIGSWIRSRVWQDNNFRNGKTSIPLDPYVKEQLTAMGESFEVKFEMNKAPQIKYIEKIKEYLNKNNLQYKDIDSSTVYIDDEGDTYKIGRWIITLRAREIAFKKGKTKKGIDLEIKAALQELGETFQNQEDINREKTIYMATLIAEYIKKFNVSIKDIPISATYEGENIGKWLYRNKVDLKNNKKSSYKKVVLYSLGFTDTNINDILSILEEYLSTYKISYDEIDDRVIYKDVDLSFWKAVLDFKETLGLFSEEELELFRQIKNKNLYNGLIEIERGVNLI